MSAPASTYAAARSSDACIPSRASASVRAMITNRSSARASTAALSRSHISSVDTVALFGRWPQRFACSWSSMCSPAAPARSSSRLAHPERDEVVDRQRLELRLVRARGLDTRDLRRAETRLEVLPELREQQRDPLGAPAPVADRIVDRDARAARAVLEEHLERVADRALVGVEVVAAEIAVLGHDHLPANRLDPGVGRGRCLGI